MACDSFTNCVFDPFKDTGLPAEKTFESISSTAIFSINLALYIFYVLLLVWIVWFLFKGVYTIIGADSSESFEKFRGAITNAVFAVIGLILLLNARFIFIVALRLIGIDGAENIFTDEGIGVLFGP